jgi:D-alanyl-lipoteichoic acid acyltransferase DltB (MBOAT superfamily)
MSFGSAPYLAFIVLIVIAVHCAPGRKLREWMLLAASMFFYSAWDIRFLPLLLGVSFGGWILGAAVAGASPRFRPWVIGFGIAGLMMPLAFFKYSGFLLENLASLGIHHAPSATKNIVLPIGISFFTFQAVSYVCDVAKGRLAPESSLLRFSVYMTFFPHLAAGPIIRAADFLPQLHAPWRAPSATVVTYSVARFLWGLFKKLCVADHLSVSFVDLVFANLSLATGPTIVLATFAFGLQIYADFSGYSDIAIASARLLGFRLRPNFDAPYLATSPAEFWRRWHISLSTLIRDYVYIPLGGSRGVSRFRSAMNGLFAMLVCGLWHGAAWTFVAWGGLHGLLLLVFRRLSSATRSWTRAVGGWVLTQAMVMGLWFLFRTHSFGDIQDAIDRLAAGGWKPTDLSPAFLAILAADAVLIYGEQLVIRVWGTKMVMPAVRLRCARIPVQLTFAFTVFAALLLMSDLNAGGAPFLYFQF